MGTIFTNSPNSKTSDPHRNLYKLKKKGQISNLIIS